MAKKTVHMNMKQLIHQRNFKLVGVFALIVLAGSTYYAINTRNESLARQGVIEDVVELPQNLSGVLGLDEMRTLATNDAPICTTITQVEIENEHGAVLYKVKFSDGSYRLYDAVTGLPFLETVDNDDENDETLPAGFVAGITVQQARDIAAAQRPGKTITKIELETEEGSVVYSVRFSDEGRVDIDASNGSVIRVRVANELGTSNDSSSKEVDDSSTSDSNNDSDDSIDSDDHAKEDIEDDGDRSGSNSGSGHSGSN